MSVPAVVAENVQRLSQIVESALPPEAKVEALVRECEIDRRSAESLVEIFREAA